MKGCRPSSSTPRRFANVLSKKHRVKKNTATVESQNTNLIARANSSSPKKLRLKEQGSVTQGATPKIGGTTNNLNYGAKVQHNFETTKDKEQKKRAAAVLSHHSAPIAGTSATAAAQ